MHFTHTCRPPAQAITSLPASFTTPAQPCRECSSSSGLKNSKQNTTWNTQTLTWSHSLVGAAYRGSLVCSDPNSLTVVRASARSYEHIARRPHACCSPLAPAQNNCGCNHPADTANFTVPAGIISRLFFKNNYSRLINLVRYLYLSGGACPTWISEKTRKAAIRMRRATVIAARQDNFRVARRDDRAAAARIASIRSNDDDDKDTKTCASSTASFSPHSLLLDHLQS